MLDVFIIIISSLIRIDLYLFLIYFHGTFHERFKKYIAIGVPYNFPCTIFCSLLYLDCSYFVIHNIIFMYHFSFFIRHLKIYFIHHFEVPVVFLLPTLLILILVSIFGYIYIYINCHSLRYFPSFILDTFRGVMFF